MGDGLICMREPGNTHDANAVVLLSITGTPVGYVQRAAAVRVAQWMDEGRPVAAKVVRPSRITRAVPRPNFLAIHVTYPTAVIWAEEPPAESFESEDAVEMEKQRILETTA
jgi:hypothetical protein